MAFSIIFMIMSLAQFCGWSEGKWDHTYNVLKYGAVGDGTSDDSRAFMNAWKDACKDRASNPILLVPANKQFLLKPVRFEGPCASKTIEVQVEGNIIAPKMSPTWDHLDKDTWIDFRYVNGLTVHGHGIINGRGQDWWKLSCIKDAKSCERPQALAFHNCNEVQAYGLKIVDTPRSHISVYRCNGVKLSNFSLTAPEDSPNTDGVDISESMNILLSDSYIATGDDCVAINGGSCQINITNVACGPGHGISVGSLGRHGAYDTVEKVYVKNCSFTRTTNGARIKTWQGGLGYARQITFEQIRLVSVKNPIIIDQYYDSLGNEGNNGPIQVSDITYRDVRGTSATKEAIVLNCAKKTPCTNITLDQINIASERKGTRTYACCNNVRGKATNTSPVVRCLN